ncbi:MAG: DUF1294 domain-containing protein [bacterium]|nr:DUF1294 domain-containing protein [bacterium]
MSWFLSLNLITQILLLYLVAINIVAFFFFGLDKLKSQLSRHRVSEKALWFLALLGGTPGSLFGMYFFRHKTRKDSFQIVLALILGVQIIIYILFIN